MSFQVILPKIYFFNLLNKYSKRIMSKVNQKLNVFEALEEIFNPKPPAYSGSMVSDAKIVILPPDNDGSDTDEDDGGDSNGIRDNLCKNQLLADAELELEYVGPQSVTSTDQPSTSEPQQVPLLIWRYVYLYTLLIAHAL